jgi:hypothetical protein
MTCSLPSFPLLTTLVVNAFDRHTQRSKLEEIFALLRTSAPVLAHIRVTASILRIPGAPTTTLRWDPLFAFVLDTKSHPPALKTLSVSIARSRKPGATFEEVLDIAEKEANHARNVELAVASRLELILHSYDHMGNTVERRLRKIDIGRGKLVLPDITWFTHLPTDKPPKRVVFPTRDDGISA